jgi:hypothetical protein
MITPFQIAIAADPPRGRIWGGFMMITDDDGKCG